ncbi:alpha/beta-hydrolase [Rhizopus microsporus var. microsporus]|uniref:sn-1-specific diacylglycerol lipase n=1 Tax=Rhizopus microsporus var. microsporus TaxID=86635 RepID=A0A1X0QQ50_RHIZD|nr:alpha/beta-hydrolase [Rhizopus microsporus var. microsporus]
MPTNKNNESSVISYHEPSLLPQNVASMVTTVSLATRVSLKCSSLLVDTIFGAAKYGTSMSLCLSRNAITHAISTAKHLHSNDQDNLFIKTLEKYTNAGLNWVSHTFSLAELLTISGIQFTSRTIQSTLKAAEESVRIFDNIFGSNETSRAIAYIITRLNKEFLHDPDFDLAKAGRIAVLTGLTKALTAFAVLQNVTYKRRTIPSTLLWEANVGEDPEERQRHVLQFKLNEDAPPSYYSTYHTQRRFSIPVQFYCDETKKCNSMPILYPIAHFIRYASAAYGESFMRILGIGDIPATLPNDHHPNHHAFAHHTNNSVQDILLSTYTDPSPFLKNSALNALVHYVTVDHTAKAIVLTCRGTLGLSDLLTDLSFDYSEFTVPATDQVFMAHSGMLKAAQFLAKQKGKVFQKIRQGMTMYPDYGLVLCGHSLGGGVASLLTVLWSQKRGAKFTTSLQSGLPPGRSIHCYAYGPPGVMSLDLSHYCQGLVTTVVHGYDFVSSLSLGLLQDFKNVARNLHAEENVTEEIISRVMQRMKKSQEEEQDDDEDQWFWAMIKTMRADMNAEKMYPPGTVYLITTENGKVRLSRCDDVHARFSEIVFSRTMFMDHSPYLYEQAIQKLYQIKLK